MTQLYIYNSVGKLVPIQLLDSIDPNTNGRPKAGSDSGVQTAENTKLYKLDDNGDAEEVPHSEANPNNNMIAPKQYNPGEANKYADSLVNNTPTMNGSEGSFEGSIASTVGSVVQMYYDFQPGTGKFDYQKNYTDPNDKVLSNQPFAEAFTDFGYQNYGYILGRAGASLDDAKFFAGRENAGKAGTNQGGKSGEDPERAQPLEDGYVAGRASAGFPPGVDASSQFGTNLGTLRPFLGALHDAYRSRGQILDLIRKITSGSSGIFPGPNNHNPNGSTPGTSQQGTNSSGTQYASNGGTATDGTYGNAPSGGAGSQPSNPGATASPPIAGQPSQPGSVTPDTPNVGGAGAPPGGTGSQQPDSGATSPAGGQQGQNSGAGSASGSTGEPVDGGVKSPDPGTVATPPAGVQPSQPDPGTPPTPPDSTGGQSSGSGEPYGPPGPLGPQFDPEAPYPAAGGYGTPDSPSGVLTLLGGFLISSASAAEMGSPGRGSAANNPNGGAGTGDPIAPQYGDGGAVGAAADVGAGDQQISPLVLDLTGAGINLTALSVVSPYFDIAGTGFARKTGWIGAGTGLLAIDRNGDGQISDITELFGQHGSVLDGFAALNTLDSNGDGVIDAQDAAFSQLRVWVNPERDGIVHPGELLTLAQLGITSISLAAVATNQVIAGNTVKLTSSYTLADGTTRTIADAWFSNNATYTQQVAGVTLSADVMALPDLLGHGTMAGLRASMTADPVLKALVAAFAANPGQAMLADVQAILLQWSGSAAIDPGSRGGNFDARELDFLEKYTGIPFAHQDGNPAWRAVINLQEGWNAALDAATARLVLQAGNSFPEFKYDAKDDIVLPATTLTDALYSLEDRLGDVTASNIGQWDLALRVADAFRLDTHIDTGYYLAAIEQNAPDSVVALASAIAYGMHYSVDQAGNVSLTGVTEHATLYAGVGNTNIQINGGDTGLAPPLDDTVVFNAYDGHLELGVNDHSDTRSDTLLFGAGIEASDVTVRLNASGNLILSVGSTGDQVQVDAMFTGAVDFHGSVWNVGTYYDSGVTSIQFADGTMWTRDQIHAMALTATTGADVIYGTDQAETFDGLGAPAGSQDLVQGGGGADTFVFNAGYGQLEINEQACGTSVLQLGTGITAAAVSITRDQAGNVFLTGGIAGDQVKLDGMLGAGNWNASGPGVAQVQFADGTVVTRQQIAAMTTTGTAGADTLYADGGINTFDGHGAAAGSQDYEQSIYGNDTFVFKAGYGHLEVNFTTGGMWSDSGVALRLGAGITAAEVGVTTDQAGNLFLTDGIAGDRVELDGMMNLNPWGAHDRGVGYVRFADGTVWTAQQVRDQLPGSSKVFTALTLDKGQGQVTTAIPGTGTISLGAGIAASDVYLQTDTAGSLIVRLRDSPGDSLTVSGALYSDSTGLHSQVGQFLFADGSSSDLTHGLTFDWIASSTTPTLAGSNSGANVFELAPGGALATGSSQTANTYVFHQGDGQAQVVPGGGSNTLVLGAGITPANVVLQVDDAGDLTVLLPGSGDALTIEGDLSRQGGQTVSMVGQIAFADGTGLAAGQSYWSQGQALSFTWAGSGSGSALMGSDWGANTFVLGAGGDQVTFGNGSLGGSNQNTVLWGRGNGQAVVNLNGAAGSIQLGAGISAADVVLQADDAGDLTISLAGDAADSLLVKGDLYSSWGINSRLGQLTFADGTSLNLSTPSLTWVGTAANTLLAGSGWGSNTFVLGAGGDQVTFSTGSLGGSNQNTVVFGRGDGQATINVNGAPGTLRFAPGISASDVILQADTAGDLMVVLRDDPADSVTLQGDLYSSWGINSRVSQLTFADGTSLNLYNPSLTWEGTAANTVLAGSGWGPNTFELGAGGDQVIFGAGSQGGSSSNTVLFGRGDGQATVNVNGATGTVQLGAGIAASDLTFQANDATGDLTVLLAGDPADSMTLKGDLYSSWGTNSRVGQLVFADGTAMTLGPNLALTWTGTAANTALTGSGFGSNTFVLEAGGDQVTFGDGNLGGLNQNTVLFGRGDGAATVNLNGGAGTVKFAAGISATDVLLQADDATGDLKVVLADDPADSVTLKGDLYNSWGINSRLSQLTFADGTSLNLNNPSLTWTGTTTNTVLTGSGFGPNTFVLGAGGDQVTFGNGSQGGSRSNTVLFGKGDGAATVSLNGGNGVVQLGKGIALSDILFSTDANKNLTLVLKDTGDSLAINGGLASSEATIQGVTFADGTTLAQQQIAVLARIFGTTDADVLTGGSGADAFDGEGAPAGTQDTEQGNGGADTFIFNKGYGQLEVNEDFGFWGGTTAVLKLGAGIAQGDVSITKDLSGNVFLTDGTSGDRVEIDDLMSNAGYYGPEFGVAQVQFADGTTLSRQQLTTMARIVGTSGADNLVGISNADTFDGEGAPVGTQDTEQGDGYADKYIFNKGYGHLEVNEDVGFWGGTTAVLEVGAGITVTDVSATRDGSGNVFLADGVAGDRIEIDGLMSNAGYYGPEFGVAQVQFADGTTLSRQQLMALTNIGTTGADTLTGYSNASTFDGEGAPAGTQDTEQGDGYADKFIFNKGYGHLEVNEDVGFWGGTTAVLKVGSGLTAADISATKDGVGNVFLTDGTAGDQVEIDGMMSNAGYYSPEFGVAQVQFSDGTAWSRNQVVALASMGTAGSDVINGTAGNDILDGRGGGDVINGAGGYDTYLFRQGYGALTIDNSTAGGSTAQGEIDFGPGITGQNLWLSQAGNDLMISVLNSTDTVDLKGWFGANPSAQLAEVKGYDGLKLDSQVGQLVTAMAAYAGSNAGFDPATASALPTDPALRSALAAAWHS